MRRRSVILTGAAAQIVVLIGGYAHNAQAQQETGAQRGRSSMSLEAIARELKDRTDILETKYAYCRHADNLDPAGMISLFTNDCQVNYVALDPAANMRGKDQLHAMLTDYFHNSVSSSHFITNAEI